MHTFVYFEISDETERLRAIREVAKVCVAAEMHAEMLVEI